MGSALTDAAVHRDLLFAIDAFGVIDGLQLGSWTERAIWCHSSSPWNVLRTWDMPSSNGQFLEACWSKDLSTELVSRANVDQLGRAVHLGCDLHNISQTCSQVGVGRRSNEIAGAQRRNGGRQCATILHPLVAATVQDAHISVTVGAENPHTPGCEPIVLVAVQHHFCVFVDSRSSCRLFELGLARNVAIDGVHELGVPAEVDCIRDMTLFVHTRVGAYFDDAHLRVVQVCFQPSRFYDRGTGGLGCCGVVRRLCCRWHDQGNQWDHQPAQRSALGRGEYEV